MVNSRMGLLRRLRGPLGGGPGVGRGIVDGRIGGKGDVGALGGPGPVAVSMGGTFGDGTRGAGGAVWIPVCGVGSGTPGAEGLIGACPEATAVLFPPLGGRGTSC